MWWSHSIFSDKNVLSFLKKNQDVPTRTPNMTTRPDFVGHPPMSVFRTPRPTETQDTDGLRVPRAEVFVGGGVRGAVLCGGGGRGAHPMRSSLPRRPLAPSAAPRRCGLKDRGRWRRRPRETASQRHIRHRRHRRRTTALTVPPRFSDTPHTHDWLDAVAELPFSLVTRISFAPSIAPPSIARSRPRGRDRPPSRSQVHGLRHSFLTCEYDVGTTLVIIIFIMMHVIHSDRWNCFGGAYLVYNLFARANGPEVLS